MPVWQEAPVTFSRGINNLSTYPESWWQKTITKMLICSLAIEWYHRADSRYAPSQWETALLCNDVSHWLGASLKSALYHMASYNLADIGRWPVNSPHKRPVTRKIFPFDDVIMSKDQWVNISSAGLSCISDPGFVISGGVDLLETKLTVPTERWLQNYTCFIHSFIGFPIYVNLLDRMTSLKWPTGWHEISWHFECTLR